MFLPLTEDWLLSTATCIASVDRIPFSPCIYSFSPTLAFVVLGFFLFCFLIISCKVHLESLLDRPAASILTVSLFAYVK